ncbi:hypothetical protein DQ04_07511010 [Trypanosoma grayi]|uniref:hypothetical protein n=1 Tax=Trypanosoma grayi TaxID=71804 RepID=UPI0004F40250|nr:hypothetical protein DQ04_07511010 [Trypanosoma grayi]KEG08294.1 hypothetical protein DQ04_07511010 [Trypanosoma grayi]
MAVGGGTSSSSGVLAPSMAGGQIIQLCSRLVVGVRLHGTLVAAHPRNPGHLKCRPFLCYFAETLRRLRCDVTLFTPIASRTGTQQLSAHEFPCPYRAVCDPTSGVSGGGGSGPGGRRRSEASRSNFQDYMYDIAADLQTSPRRILFIDSEINYRFSPVQTLVVEAFQPQRVRQQERPRLSRADEVAAEEARRARQHAAVLEGEYAWTQGQRGQTQQQQHERHHCTPFSSELCGDLPQSSSVSNKSRSSDNDSAGAVRAAALAINREDFTLVALAGMLVELAAAEVAVADYLRVEPLVEKLTVPFHGAVNYLPAENCDDMEQWDWDAVEVREAKRAEAAAAVPEVEEREEHHNLFK